MKANYSKGKTIGFSILLILVCFVLGFLLEIAKNTILGWVIFAALIVFFILIRRSLKRKNRWNVPFLLLSWLCFLLLFALNFKLTGPPYRAVPAVSAKNPVTTETVSLPQGDLTGVLTEDSSVEVYAGIPYAAPPVGNLRFREPQPPEKWDGVRKCDTFAPMAMQQRPNILYNSLQQILGTHDYRISLHDNYQEPLSEDCLYLNIWKPAESSDEPLPVLFYVHGGSLMTGQSYDSAVRGESFAKKGVIVVNFAYRLGVFGYYANEELEAESQNGTTGDYGLLDQIAALKWVHDNIAYFGGDPERITIAGESAGSSSVNALCVSPLTEGLFQYAIAESSGISAPHPYHTFREREEAFEMGQEILKEMGASDISALRDIPAEKLVQTKYRNSAMMIDGYAITEQPYDTYLRGGNHEEALLNGFNAKEADAFLLDTEATSENYEELLNPIAGEYAPELAAIVPPGSVTRDQVFITDKGGDAKGALCHVYSAAWFTYSHHVWSSHLLSQGKPVYEYYFTKVNNQLSNFHAGEIPYAYGNLWRRPELYNDSDFALSETMQNYWVNFIKTGDPNGEGLPHWEPRNTDSEQVLVLNDTIEMSEDPYLNIYPVLDRYQAEN